MKPKEDYPQLTNVTTDTEKETKQSPLNRRKRTWKSPEIIEEDYRNTEEQPNMPFSPSQVS
ncbi:hypothetical protein BH23BAC3_BH23BAC3_21850 [soil metagenome]